MVTLTVASLDLTDLEYAVRDRKRRLSQARFHPSIRVTPLARLECIQALTNIGRTKRMQQRRFKVGGKGRQLTHREFQQAPEAA
jgi:hypothetical protein